MMGNGQGDMASEIKKSREDNAEMRAAHLSTLSMAVISDSYEMHKEVDWQAEIKKMKAEREAERIAWEIERKKLKGGYKIVWNELKAMKLKQRQDRDQITALCLEVAETKKNLEVHDEKLQNHNYRFSIRKVDPVEDFIIGKWKLTSATGQAEYEEQLVDYDQFGGVARITYDNRSFTYRGGILMSYIDHYHDHPDPIFSSDYTVNNRKLMFTHNKKSDAEKFQIIHIWHENYQLIVTASIYEKGFEANSLANCKCIYDRP